MERSHVDPVTRSLASLLSAGAAGGCKVGAVNCCTYLQRAGGPCLKAIVKHLLGGWQLKVFASNWTNVKSWSSTREI